MKRYVCSIAGMAALAALSGCAERAPYYQSKFGEAATMVRAQQVIDPDASQNRNPVKGIDGMAGAAATDRYHKSFENPPPPATILNIGVGGR